MFAIRHRIRATRIGGAAVLLMLSQFGPAQAAVLFDQIDLASTTRASNQYFIGSFETYDIRLIDDFTLAQSASLSRVSIDLFGVTDAGGPRFMGFGRISAWSISIWSSQAAAIANNTVGDIHQSNLSPADVALIGTVPLIPLTGLPAGQSVRVLAELPLVAELTAGTYWLGVTPSMTYDGQLGIGTKGAGNGVQINGRGGFRLPGNVSPRLTNAGFRLEGTLRQATQPNGAVPEPASWAMMIAGFGLVGAAARRRRPARPSYTFVTPDVIRGPAAFSR